MSYKKGQKVKIKSVQELNALEEDGAILRYAEQVCTVLIPDGGYDPSVFIRFQDTGLLWVDIKCIQSFQPKPLFIGLCDACGGINQHESDECVNGKALAQ